MLLTVDVRRVISALEECCLSRGNDPSFMNFATLAVKSDRPQYGYSQQGQLCLCVAIVIHGVHSIVSNK